MKMHSAGNATTNTQAEKNSNRRIIAQAMTEFALAIPIVLMLMYAIIEGGRLLWIYTSVSAAGREAARYAAGIGSSGAQNLYNDCNGIKAAAVRIGGYAGITPSSVHIYHDTGPGTTATEYCISSNPTLASIAQGDRVQIKVSTIYRPIVPLLPGGPLTLRSESAHTVLVAVQVIAATPQSLPVTQTCNNIPYTIKVTDPLGPVVKVDINNANTGHNTKIQDLLVIWDVTSGPVISSITGWPFNIGTISSGNTGPVFTFTPSSPGITWDPGTNPSASFTLTFSKVLKNNVIVRIDLLLDDKLACSFGK